MLRQANNNILDLRETPLRLTQVNNNGKGKGTTSSVQVGRGKATTGKTPAAVIRSRGLKDITNKTPGPASTTHSTNSATAAKKRQNLNPTSSVQKPQLTVQKLGIKPSCGSGGDKGQLLHEKSSTAAADVIVSSNAAAEDVDDYEIEYMAPSQNIKLLDQDRDFMNEYKFDLQYFKPRPSVLNSVDEFLMHSQKERIDDDDDDVVGELFDSSLGGVDDTSLSELDQLLNRLTVKETPSLLFDI